MLLVETTSKTKKDTEQYSQSEVLQRHRCQRQKSWTLSQSFLAWLEKQVTQFQRTLESKCPKLPDGYNCRRKNVLNFGTELLHDKDREVGRILTIFNGWKEAEHDFVVTYAKRNRP